MRSAGLDFHHQVSVLCLVIHKGTYSFKEMQFKIKNSSQGELCKPNRKCLNSKLIQLKILGNRKVGMHLVTNGKLMFMEWVSCYCDVIYRNSCLSGCGKQTLWLGFTNCC